MREHTATLTTAALRSRGLAALSLLLAGCTAMTPPAASPSSARLADATAVALPGVPLPLARERAASISNIRYDLALDVTARDSAAGALELRFLRRPGSGDLLVDFRGSALDSVAANGAALDHYAWNDGHVRFAARHLRAGENRLTFRFAGRIAPAGASVIRFDDPSDLTTYEYTLLVTADANALFPSFDQPDLKGVFTVAVTAPAGWTVLANGAEVGRDTVARGVRWRFAPTQPISTYLVAFAAGPWTTWTSAPQGERPITLYARRSQRAGVDADTLLRINRDALAWLEGYFGIRYPFEKLDLLLAPAFPFGGMEHVGAIFYNENRFVFREPPTLSERLARKGTIYHEVAHQWFGDLVTMRWFDDLWLKEGFATYMAAKMQAALDPGSGAWKTFYQRNKPLAYGVDVTAGTTPVWQELANLDLAKSNYGPIVYNKAPGILKQLDFLVGDSVFQAGVRLFLRRHAYGNADWRELLAALEETSGTSLEAFAEQYILRAGIPVVEPRLETQDGAIRRLALTQRPARQMGGDAGGWWPGRVRVRLGYAEADDVVLPVEFTGDTTEIREAAGLPEPDWIFANDGDYGYGLFLLDGRSAEYLLAHIGGLDDELLRAMAWGGLWELVREARLPPAEYVELALRELPAETDEQIAAAILSRAGTALARYLDDAERARLQPRWERLLLARAGDAGLLYGLRKSSLDALLAGARTPAAQRALREYLAGERHFDGEPLQQPSRWRAVTTLLALDDPDADSLLRGEEARDTTAEAPRRAFVAGAAIPDAANKAEYFRRYLGDPGLNEAWVTASLEAFDDPGHAALTLPYLRPALEQLEWIRENRRIFFLPQWVTDFPGGQTGSEALGVVDDFLADNPDLPPDLRRKVLQARDDLERTVRIRQKWSGRDREFLRADVEDAGFPPSRE